MNMHVYKSARKQTRPAALPADQLQNHDGSEPELTDQRPMADVQRVLQKNASNSPKVKQLSTVQAYANNHIFSKKVAQGVFIYSFEFDAIHAANKKPAYYQSLHFQPFLSGDGFQVFANPQNKEAVKQSAVSGEVFSRQYRIAREKLKNNQANSWEHEIRDKDTGLHFIKDGTVYEDLLIIQPFGAGIYYPIFSGGTEFCIKGDSPDNPQQIIEITKKMVTDYWETPKEDAEAPGNQGSFAEELGYKRDEYLGPDERYNCAAYALGHEKAWIEPEKMHEILSGEDYAKLSSHSDMQIGKDYIFATQFHFWRARKNGKDEYLTSEKNGASAVYNRKLSAEQWQELMGRYFSIDIFIKK